MESMAKTRTFHSSGCMVYTIILTILVVLFRVMHGDSSGNETKYVRPGEFIELMCPYKKTVNDTPQWLFKTNDFCETITDQYEVNPSFQNYSFSIAQNKTFNLKITNITYQHEGTYMCTTRYQGKTLTKMFFVYLMKPPFEVRVVNMTKENRIVGKENENLTLACYTLGGILRGKTIWYYGKKKLTMNKDDSEWAYYSFTLNKNDNEQIYTCIAGHDMLRTSLEQSIKLDILYHPRVECLWPKEPVSVGHDVNVSCSYYSNPLDAGILWTKNCQNIGFNYSIVTKIAVGNDRNRTKIEDMTKEDHGVTAIMITNVNRSDAGAYTCSVTNTEGSASETIYLAVQDNGGETITDSVPPHSGISVKGFLAKEQILYGVFIVLFVLVLIIISLVAHVYIWNRCKQTNYTVPQREVVRHSPIEIEMLEVSNNEEDVHEEPRNLPLLSEILPDLQNTASGDSQSDLSKTNTSQSSSLHSNRSQNEEDYLYLYHGFVHSGLDVHEYATVDVQESTEYEEITNTL